MLRHLMIHHVGLIDEAELDLDTGLTVFTGETGAGKSLFVDALGLLLGQPGSDDLIQSGVAEAVVEGVFEPNVELLPEEFREFLESDSQLIIRRKLIRGKSSLCKINGQTVPVKKLKSLAAFLVNMTAQHEQVVLFDPLSQLSLLDVFCGEAVAHGKREYKTVFEQWRQTTLQLNRLRDDHDRLDQKKEFLSFQLQDIDTQGFVMGEDDDLEKKKREFKSLHQLREALAKLQSQSDTAYELLTDNAILSGKLGEIKPVYKDISKSYHTILVEMEDILQTVQAQAGHLAVLEEIDIEEVESRLDTLFKYKAKYHTQSIAELLILRDHLADELNGLEKSDQMKHDLENRRTSLEAALKEQADTLTKLRNESAPRLARQIEAHLTELHFTQPQFFVRFNQAEGFLETGHDKVEFQISTNPGSPPLALPKVVSGGELSRILLALKTVFFNKNTVPTLVFDEIDTGVGGITAIKIGEKLKLIAQSCQVLCVTHLPQIAKFSDHHVVMSKHVENNMTRTLIRTLSDNEVSSELHRMVGGEDVLAALR